MRTAFLAIAALVIAVGVSPISNNDIWLHLTTGRLILEKVEIPRVDDYSFTRAGSSYVAHEWLAQIFFFLVFKAAGLAGLIALKPLALGATALLVATSCHKLGGGDVASFWAAALAVVAMTSHLFARPHLFTFVMLSTTSLLVARWRSGNRRAIVTVALLQVLWANLHGGFVLGILLAFCLGGWVVAGIMAVVSLLNPYGFGLYRFVLVFADPVFRARIREWASPFDPPFLGSFHFYVYLGLLLLTAAAAAHCVRSKRYGPAVALCLFAALSVASKRNVSVLGVVAAPWIGLSASQVWRGVQGGSGNRRARALAASTAAVSMLAVGAATYGVPHETGRFRRPGLGVADNVPVSALDYVESHGINGNALNSFAFGSYITFRAYPSSRVAIDSRLDVFGGPFVEQYTLAMIDPERMRDLLGRYRIDYAVLSYRLDDVEGPVSNFAEGGWALVYYDDLAMVYVRRQGRFADLIATDEYRRTNPYLFMTGRWSAGDDPRGAMSEAERAVSTSPSSIVARLIEGTALQAAGRHREAITLFEQIAARPDSDPEGQAVVFGLLGTSYLETGDEPRARQAFERLRELAPDSAYARKMLESMEPKRRREQ